MNTDRTTTGTRTILDKYFNKEVTFPAEQIDAVQGFFMKRGFAIDASRSLSIVFLNQALLDKVNVFELLDRLKNISDMQLSSIVMDILNAYRDKSSMLGYKRALIDDSYESRNIVV